LLVVLGGLSGAVFTLWNQKPVVEVAVVQKSANNGGREALLNASGYVTPRRRATIAAKITGRVTGVFARRFRRAQSIGSCQSRLCRL
jgi:hypothetical protein